MGLGVSACVSSSAYILAMTTGDRRRTRRRRVLLGARISHRGLGMNTECRVRDLSDIGACLVIASPAGVPDTFDMMFADGVARPCKVQWRKADKIGVSFLP